MATQSSKDNVLETLKDSILMNYIDEEELDIIAQNIVENLQIEFLRVTKWD